MGNKDKSYINYLTHTQHLGRCTVSMDYSLPKAGVTVNPVCRPRADLVGRSLRESRYLRGRKIIGRLW